MSGKAALHLGCAGWSLSRAYLPSFPEQGSHLQRYAATLPAVEINTSFYRPHKPETYQRWAQAVPGHYNTAAGAALGNALQVQAQMTSGQWP